MIWIHLFVKIRCFYKIMQREKMKSKATQTYKNIQSLGFTLIGIKREVTIFHNWFNILTIKLDFKKINLDITSCVFLTCLVLE